MQSGGVVMHWVLPSTYLPHAFARAGFVPLLGTLLLAVDRAWRAASNLVPSYVMDITHLDTDKMEYRSVYRYSLWSHLLRPFTHGVSDARFPSTGSYAIRVWNRGRMAVETHVLTADHLMQACGVRRMSVIAALMDGAFAEFLSTYVHAMRVKGRTLFAIVLDTVDVTRLLNTYMPSMEVPFNVTPATLMLLCASLRGETLGPRAGTEILCRAMDFDLEERLVGRDEPLVTRTRES